MLYLVIQHEEMYYNLENGCFDKETTQQNIDYDHCYNWFAGCSQKSTAHCQVDSISDTVHCSNKIEIAMGESRFMYVSVGYFCGLNETLNMKYDIKLTDMKTVTCTTFNTDIEIEKICSEYYSEYGFPNVMAYSKEKVSLVMTTLTKTYNNSRCYKYIYEFACRSLLPNCHLSNNTLTGPPCRQMCLDWINGCKAEMNGNIHSKCTNQPNSLDPNVCAYNTVSCPGLPMPDNGRIIYQSPQKEAMEIVTYECDKPYTLQGDKHRTCMYGGYWNGTMPHCSNAPIITKIVIILLVTVVAVIIIISPCIVIAVRYKLEIKTLFHHRRHHQHQPNHNQHNRKYNAFLSYDFQSNDDISFVRNTLYPGILNGHPDVQLCIEEELDPGMPLAASIEKALSDSSAIILILSQSNIDSEYFEFSFKLAQDINSKDGDFQFVVILFQPLKNLQNLQPHIKKYLDFGKRFNIVKFVAQDNIIMCNIIQNYLKL